MPGPIHEQLHQPNVKPEITSKQTARSYQLIRLIYTLGAGLMLRRKMCWSTWHVMPLAEVSYAKDEVVA